MPASPCLGYATKRLAILALDAKGVDPHDIAAEVGSHVNAVRARLLEARRKGLRAAAPKPPANAKRAPALRRPATGDVGGRPVEAVPLNEDIKRVLRPHAKRRDMTVLRLAQLIIETVVDGGLVDAVLDDGEG